jgi:hypothetical protein
MKIRSIALCAALALACGTAAAQDKKDAMKDTAKPMTMQECKDYTAMATKDAKMKDAKKDTMCADMMKKDGGMMKKDDMAPKK